MGLYYNPVTSQIKDWNELKSLFGTVFNSVTEGSNGMHIRLWTDPMVNTFLPTYPDLANWFVLDQTPTPSTFLYQIAVEDTPEFVTVSGATYDKGKYKKTHIIRNRTLSPMNEMVGVNQHIVNRAKEARDAKLEGAELEYDGFFADATDQTTLAISRLIEFLKSKGDPNETISWKGLNDSFGLPRWKNATMADLQELSVLVEDYRQKAFTAEKLVLQEQLNNLAIDIETTFATLSDVEQFYNDTYDNL